MFRKRHPPRGARPGTLVLPKDSPPPRIHAIHYAQADLKEFDVGKVASLRPPEKGVLWVDVQGLGDEAVLRELGDAFGLHPLVLEDIVHCPQRPKVEEHDTYHFMITRALTRKHGVLKAEQISILYGMGWVLTFQEIPGDDWNPVRQRIRNPMGRMRQHGADYLAYALLDAIIDGYFPVLEDVGNDLERCETAVLRSTDGGITEGIHALKRDLLSFRRTIFPQVEALHQLLRSESSLVSEPVRVFLRDCLDHCTQCLEEIEAFREIGTELVGAHLAALSNRTSEVMKMLTVISSIFIPLSFVAGLYGMNFRHMPGLEDRWGYPLVLLVMSLVALFMVAYFRRRRWIEWPGKKKKSTQS